MPELSWQKILVVLVIALIVLGPAKLPEAARSVGKGLREFRGAMGGLSGLGDVGGRHEASEPSNASARTDDVPATSSRARASELPPAGLPPAAAPPVAAPDAAEKPASTYR